MWKEYSVSYIKRNKTASISMMIISLTAALFFSMICCVFYNLWRYDIEHIIREEGDWQGRIVGEIDRADIEAIQSYGNVKKVNTWQNKMGRTVVDIYFEDMRRTYRDMPQIIRQAELTDVEMSCHEYLLSQYLIFDPEDEQPPMLLRFFILVMALMAVSLILIIKNAFAVSMNARIHQMGILSSIGATPRQIRICLWQEAFALCAFPILAGSVGGIGLSLGFIRFMEWAGHDMTGRMAVRFQYHPAVFLVTVLASGMTVLLSAWIPARKMSRMTPLQAVRNAPEYQLKKGKNSWLLTAFFGMEGELAGNAIKARKPALRTSFLSLTLSFGAFGMFLCFITLSEISVNYTYYEKYKDSWDVMVKITSLEKGTYSEASIVRGKSEVQEKRDTQEKPDVQEEPDGQEKPDIWERAKTETIRKVDGVESCVMYQKATVFTQLKEEDFSEELQSLGGIGGVDGSAVQNADGTWQAEVPLVILDDEGFAQYCREIGVRPQMDGSIMLNRIWDSVNSNFRYREYVPFVKESVQELILTGEEGEEPLAEIKVLAHTQETPVLREEYDDYALVQVIPASLWRQIEGQVGKETAEQEVYLRILASDDSKVYGIEEAVKKILEDTYPDEYTEAEWNPYADGYTGAEWNPYADGYTGAEWDPYTDEYSGRYSIEIENRVQEEITNSNIMKAYRLVIGTLCGLLAVIGLANIFSNTLGFLYQRRREFARYLSVGVTPKGIRKILWIEALVTAGRPILVTLPLIVLFVAFAVHASYLDPWEFIVAAPIVPMLLFAVSVFLFVGVAYYIGGRGLLRSNLSEILRDDVMV